MSVSQSANVELGAGSGRNAFAYNPELRVSAGPFQKKQRKTRSDIGVKPISVEKDVNTGKFICPEESCRETFTVMDDLLSHLVDKTLACGHRATRRTENSLASAAKGTERKCPVCEHIFPLSTGNKRSPLFAHIERHFPGELACGGKCGNLFCGYVAGLSRDLRDHIAAKLLTLKCECGESFRRQTDLDMHIEKHHVGLYQIVGYARRAGFDVGLFGAGLLWMRGPTADNDVDESLSSRLAERAAKAVVAARKESRETSPETQWTGLHAGSGGVNGINPRRICDACRKKGGRKCIHRFEADAPDPARDGPIQITRCQACKLKDRKCRHTHYPVAQCENCGIDCRFCAHQ